MKSRGASVIFVNSSNEIVLFLRDDDPEIAFPNRWDLPGGRVERGETPRGCIVREIKEEMRKVGEDTGYTLRNPQLFKVTEFDDREEHTFISRDEFDPEDIILLEGQTLKWFSKDEVEALEPDSIAFGFRPLLLEFFDRHPKAERGT